MKGRVYTGTMQRRSSCASKAPPHLPILLLIGAPHFPVTENSVTVVMPETKSPVISHSNAFQGP